MFSIDRASSLTGVSRSQLDNWSESGFFPATHDTREHGVPHARLYSFQDLVALRAIKRLQASGVSTAKLKRFREKVRHLTESPWTGLRVGVVGKGLVYFDPQLERWLDMEPEDQLILELDLGDMAKELEAEVRQLQKRPEDTVGKVDRSRFILGNSPVLAGTRVLVSTIREFMDAKYTDQEILGLYPYLSPADLDAVRAHGPTSKKSKRTA